jgi:protein gp37
MHPNWANTLRDQCAHAGIPFLFKQWGEWLPGRNDKVMEIMRDGQWWARVGKHVAGRHLDGVLHDGYPCAV